MGALPSLSDISNIIRRSGHTVATPPGTGQCPQGRPGPVGSVRDMAARRSPAAAGEATPTLSRRHAAGAGSARGLLFTVLGEFVLPGDGTVWTSSLIDVLSRLGVEPKTTRQALMRTAADGWIRSERHGRRTRWALTPSAVQLLTDGTQRIYGFRGVATAWDQRVVLVLARIPEPDRATRHVLR